MDVNDRRKIFESVLPEEKFIDRRIARLEDIDPEITESQEVSGHSHSQSQGNEAKAFNTVSTSDKELAAKSYVGELFGQVENAVA